MAIHNKVVVQRAGLCEVAPMTNDQTLEAGAINEYEQRTIAAVRQGRVNTAEINWRRATMAAYAIEQFERGGAPRGSALHAAATAAGTALQIVIDATIADIEAALIGVSPLERNAMLENADEFANDQ